MPFDKTKPLKFLEFEAELKEFSPFNPAPGEGTTPERGEGIAYISTFNNYDRQGEAVAPGAFTAGLTAFLNDGFIAVGHAWNILPVAYPMEAWENEKGLCIRFKFHSVPEAQYARRVMYERFEDGKTVKFSIGYQVLESEQTADGILLTKIQLWEASYVNVPANPMADLVAIKGENSNDYYSKSEDYGQWRFAGPDLRNSAQHNDQTQHWRREAGGLGYDLEEDGIKSITGILVGQTYANHADAVLAAIEGLSDRTKSIAGIRMKEGRVLSTNTLARLNQLRESLQNAQAAIEELTKLGQKPKDEASAEEIAQVEQSAEELLATNPQNEENPANPDALAAETEQEQPYSEGANGEETQTVKNEQETEETEAESRVETSPELAVETSNGTEEIPLEQKAALEKAARIKQLRIESLRIASKAYR